MEKALFLKKEAIMQQNDASSCYNTTLLEFLPAFLWVIVLHHYKKYLAVAGVGAAITAIGLGLFVKTKKEEKHSCCH